MLGVPTELAVGFVAGVASRAVSTPLSVVTIRLQTEGDDDEEESQSATASDKASPPPAFERRTAAQGFFDVVRRIYAQEGLAGFWAGKRPSSRSRDLRSRLSSKDSNPLFLYASPPPSRCSYFSCSVAFIYLGRPRGHVSPP